MGHTNYCLQGTNTLAYFGGSYMMKKVLKHFSKDDGTFHTFDVENFSFEVSAD
jgi:hypothetical protein